MNTASSRRWLRAAITVVALGLALGLVVPWGIRFAFQTALHLGGDPATGFTRFLGTVRDGAFVPLDPVRLPPPRLTRIQMQEARAPESGELNLAEWEGAWLVIEGRDSGGWIYGADVWLRLDDPLTRALARLAY
ncbi:MAG: hypothetical protein V1772_09875 [Chloroflexota bacterium]